jgi:peptidoglycan/LPS O-acetylase OafA/YrhL
MNSRLSGLDGLRGLAALAVFGHHLDMGLLGGSRGSAFLAVDFFFMLSGYVMARTYEDRWSRASSAFDFLALRLKRLWPTMTVGALIAAVLMWVNRSSGDPLIIMLNILFIPYFPGVWAFPLNSSAWSIFFELIANVVHVLVLHRLGTRSLMFVALMAGVFFVAFGQPFGLDVGARTQNFLIGVPRVLLSYTIGIILWRLWRDVPTINVSQTFAFLVMPTFFIVAAMLYVSPWEANFLFIILACPMMIAGGLCFSETSRMAGLARIGGAISFPLYAVHVPVMGVVTYLNGGFGALLVAPLVVAGLFPSVRKAVREASVGPGNIGGIRSLGNLLR